MEGAEDEGKKEKNKFSTSRSIQIGKAILIYSLVLGLGLLALNQFIGFRYKSVFLQTPCDLCKELNPHLEICFQTVSNIYTTPQGEVIGNITEYTQDYFNNISKIKIDGLFVNKSNATNSTL